MFAYIQQMVLYGKRLVDTIHSNQSIYNLKFIAHIQLSFPLYNSFLIRDTWYFFLLSYYLIMAWFYKRFSRFTPWILSCRKLSQLYTSICKHAIKKRLYNYQIILRKAFIKPGLPLYSISSSWILSTVGQDIFADMILCSRISRILIKPRRYHVCEYDLNDLFTRQA